MKLTTPFNTIREVLKKQPLSEISCLIDDVEVPIKECCLELEVSKKERNLSFWEEE